MRQCGNAAMILKQKFINKNFHKKQIFVTNNPKILQISLRLFDEKYFTFRCVCGWLLKPHRRTVVGTLTCNTFAGGADVNYLWELGIYNALILSESLNCVRWYGHLPVFFNVHVTVSNKSGEGWGAISFGILSVNLNTSYGNVKRKLIYLSFGEAKR